ncbi:MAG: NAD+ synthase [Gemmatimonadaceae bacterium]|nr:NAD+ synthase [Gemmatimonadaceae bacterium]
MPRLLRLGLAQFRPSKADYTANRAQVAALIAEAAARDPRPEVVHFPETALTGYFLEGGVRDLAVSAGTLAADLQHDFRERAPDGATIDVVIGFYERWRSTLYNSVMYVSLGGDAAVIRHVHRKNFLPTYGLFDEARFVEAGRDIRAFDTPWGRAAMLVCEDAWHSITGTVAALDGAEVVFVSSAAPARGPWPRNDANGGPASVYRWERLIRDIAEEHGMFVSLSNLVGSEGGKMFSGASILAGPHGDIRLTLPLFEPALATVTLDMRDLVRARADAPLLSDVSHAWPHLAGNIAAAMARAPYSLSFDPADAPARPIVPPTPPRSAPAVRVTAGDDRISGGPAPLDIDAPLVAQWLVQFIRDEMARRGFTTAVIGLSGGVDSAVTTYLAARALGPENVFAVRMPYRSSSADSLAHAQLVIDALGIQHRTMEITAAVDGYLQHEPDADPARRGNVMARTRMITLFDLSAKHRGVPLGTGNKTERLFGYYTWHADDSPPINPLGDLYKSQVWALARHLGVPAGIIDKPASADLIQGQTDEGDFGISYARADELLNWMLNGWTPQELAERGFDARDIEIVRRRLESTHWKRRLPTVALIGPTAIGESYLRPVDY